MHLNRRDFIHRVGFSMAGLALEPSLTSLWGEEMNYTVPSAEECDSSAFVVSKGPGFGRRIAITFDDGPAPGLTEKVLDSLRSRNLKATFFMIGQCVTAAPELAKRVFSEGHEIANHSYTHAALNRLPVEKVHAEIDRCQEAIANAIGQKPVWLRPPYGAFHNKKQGALARAKMLGVTYWTVDPRDWARPGVQKVINSVLTQTRPGSIILLHDIHKSTIEALDPILDGLLEQEYEFSTISGFLGTPYEAA